MIKFKNSFFLTIFVSCVQSQSVFYDSFSARILSNEEVKHTIKSNNTFWCVNEVLPCNELEGRRLDGSCNNLKYPSRGSSHTPPLRLLAPEYDEDFEPRKSKSGKPLPLSRSVRTSVLAEGRVPGSTFTQLLLHFWVWTVGDFVSLHDTINYISWTPHCCQEKGKTDKRCIPNKIPDDDSVHRFSSIRCMNLTRPISFQSTGCVRNDTIPQRIISSTPSFDLSHLYGSSLKNINSRHRTLEKGLLKIEVSNGKIWPPSVKGKRSVCFLNQLPHETRCHDTPELGANSVLGGNLMTIWLWRLHNRIATGLALVNPCWTDDRLFFTTRDIMIGMMMQIMYYELYATLLGRDNLIKDSVLSPIKEYRDFYNENLIPQISLEFPFVLRWAHTMQEGNLKMYDAEGNYLKETKVVNLTLRTGYLEDTLEYITHGALKQPAAKIDYVVDPDIAEKAMGPHQLAADILTSDLTKNRYFGFPPYIKYRKFCSGKIYRKFDDLRDVIDPERIELLKEKYEHIEDIDLMAGIWQERPVKGGYVPVTLYCIVMDQLFRNVVTDRHWYERPNRPNAFSLDQLLEVRKASIAQVICAVGDNIKKIQPRAFLMAGPGNEIRSCDEIQKMNLYAWKDNTCDFKPTNGFNYNL